MRQSVKGLARAAVRDDKKARLNTHPGQVISGVSTEDSFVNFAHKLGIGADNPLTSGTYNYNPITRNRNLLEWIHRGSWLGGQAIDVVADDMTRAGVLFKTEMHPEDSEKIENLATTLGIWPSLNSTVRWGRLYGGAISVMLIDGQDMRTPLRLESVKNDQFKGLFTLDRWMIEPSLDDLVTEFGPQMGKPKYYKVQANAPGLRGQTIHYSRVCMRHEGVELPYQQALTENLWGISVLERLYDRMIAYDSASTGAAQLVYKAHLRTVKVKDLRSLVAAGGVAMEGLVKYMELMRRYQGIEGLTLLDAEDEFDVQVHGAFSGLDDILNQFGQQLSGALQIPLVRLFGQSPAGLSSTGESDLRNYYDGIKQQQTKQMTTGVSTVYKLMAASEGVKLPDDFGLEFASLWQLSDTEKAEVADKVGTAVDRAFDKGLIGRQTSLRELRQSSKTTGVFTNITQEIIEAADDEVMPPMGEMQAQQEHELDKMNLGAEHATKLAQAKQVPGGEDGKQKETVGGGKRRREQLRE